MADKRIAQLEAALKTARDALRAGLALAEDEAERRTKVYDATYDVSARKTATKITKALRAVEACLSKRTSEGGE